MAKICIDPGHSGIPDPGAVGPSGLKESDVTLAVGFCVQGFLQEAGHQVIMTRVADDPDTDSLGYRTEIANNAQADLFVSIHCNAAASAQAYGTETYCYHGSVEGAKLAACVQEAMVMLGLRDRGVKSAGFYVLKYTDMPAILVELAFISNAEEEALLGSADFQSRAANAIAIGINQYLAVLQSTMEEQHG